MPDHACMHGLCVHACSCLSYVGRYSVDTALKLVEGCPVQVKATLKVEDKVLKAGSIVTFIRVNGGQAIVQDETGVEWSLGPEVRRHWRLVGNDIGW